MSIFDLRHSVIDEYSKYVQSFLSIVDERVREFMEELLTKNQSTPFKITGVVLRIFLIKE